MPRSRPAVDYWLPDPRKNVLQAFRLEAGTYVVETERTGSATFRPSLFPGLSIRLADVWVPAHP